MLAHRNAVLPLNEADVESIAGRTLREKKIDLPTPHRPPYVQSSQNHFNPNSSGPLFTHGPTSNSEQSQTYRILPIIAGILIPFLVLLSIPSLTSHWYVQTHGENMTMYTRPNPPLLVVAMGLSMACGVLANICLVLRFAERSVKNMTLLCIILLSMHELINISVIIIFTVTDHFNDGFTYGQSFWMTFCSMVVSTTTNITLIIDYSHTKNFAKCGSGLTYKQRSLVIIIIVLLCYITFGSLAQTFMLKITCIDSLYFTVVSVQTIGFGDIVPTSVGTRIFVCLYISGGILNLALAVALSREALLEAAAAGFRERVKKLRARQRERHIQGRWKAAVKWRLQAKNLPLWISNDCVAEPGHESRHRYSHWWTSAKQACSLLWKKVSLMSEGLPFYAPSDKHLNLNALTVAQLEAAALEAGAPLADLLPSRLETSDNKAEKVDIKPQPPLTHMRIGGMVYLLRQFALDFAQQTIPDGETSTNHDDGYHSMHDEYAIPERLDRISRTTTMQDEELFLETLEAEEQVAFIARLSIACLLFIVFWAAGSAIFMVTEGWGIGTAAYFCFITFSTVGFGDFAPKTQAGRSIFVVWALLGVGTMTVLVSILTELYSKSYKSAIKTEMIRSSTEDASTRQRFFDSRTMVNISESSQYLPQLPLQFRNVTFPSTPNDHASTTPSVLLTQNIECDSRRQSKENMTARAHSLEILRHAEKLQLLLHSVENNEVESHINQFKTTIQDIVAAAKDGLESTV